MPPIAPALPIAAALCLALVGEPQAAGATRDQQADCGIETPCEIETGEYRIRFPTGWDGKSPLGAIVFLHGWRGTAQGEMRNAAWARLADRLNVAFVAPQGAGKTWSYPGAPRALRDEFAFFDALVEDLTTRFPLRSERMMATGFSMGGSMVWNLACYRGGLFAGFAPIAGAFWDPIPESCPSPAPVLFHVHGTADRTVPLEGRPIGERWRQSDVADSLAVWQAQAGLPRIFPASAPATGLTCQRQEAQAEAGRGTAPLLEVCLHSGGHSVRAEWVERAWRALGRHLDWSD
ncbi:alpha/beta hydrolase family esterase [Stappia stellulata]|uniref:alpha/beta hydrolase family esterase n=1 Tax=Stappia stellulata TaxID=71235 RepID=UPI0004135B47|nr:alpha/beta hydrolase-fold protein [Stappia stellulata]